MMRTLLSVSMLTLLAAVTADAEVTFYRSNASGEALGEIARSAVPEHRYVLAVDETEERTEETLYRDGEPRRKAVYGPEGEERYIDSYTYYVDGRLQEVTRRFPDGRVVKSRYEYIEGRLTAEWHTTAEEAEVFRYDDAGRISIMRRWEDEELVLERRYAYRDDGREPLRLEIDRPKRNETEVRRFDEQGRMTERVVRRDGEIVARTTMTHGPHGPVEERTESDTGAKRIGYEYDAEGELAREEHYRGGTIIKAISYGEGNGRVEELYRNGSPVLRVHYTGETRVKEEVIRDGEVVEVRDLRSDQAELD